MARFRLGNEVREGRYWEEEEKRICRLCEGQIESCQHVWKRCREWQEGGGSWQEIVGRILEEEGEGEDWMREVKRVRRVGERREN